MAELAADLVECLDVLDLALDAEESSTSESVSSSTLLSTLRPLVAGRPTFCRDIWGGQVDGCTDVLAAWAVGRPMKGVVTMLPFAALKVVLLGMRPGAGGWFWYPVGGTCDGCKGGRT